MTKATPFEERLKKVKDELATKNGHQKKEVPTEQFNDIIPIIQSSYQPTPADKEIAQILNSISIIDAYNKWCGKSKVNPQGKTESIKVSCPVAGHIDKNPSAWLNTDKNVWYCQPCEQGGDQYDIAAYHFGYSVPGYKNGREFHDLCLSMAQSLGYYTVKTPAGTLLGSAEEEPENTTCQTSNVGNKESASQENKISHAQSEIIPDKQILQSDKSDNRLGIPLATVTPIGVEYDSEDEVKLPWFDWRPLVEPNTFLDTWMRATEVDDIPDEYYFWNGMLALGLALGRDTNLYDRRPVFGNLFICIVGPTGSGKTQSEGHLSNLLRKALPYVHTDSSNYGVDIVSAPASGEVVVWSFQKEVFDPSTAKSLGHFPVRGLLAFNELSALMGRSARLGSTLKSTLMDMYDCPFEISTRSRSSGTLKANLPFASLLTTTQHKSLGRLLLSEDIDAGFVNRFIFVSGKPKKRIAIGGAKISIEESIKPIQKIRNWGKRTPQISWSPLAQKLYEEIFTTILEPAKERSEVLSRIDLLTKKLILLFSANEMHSEVQVSSVEKMYALLEYIFNCYGTTSDQIGNNTAWQLKEDIERHVKKHSVKGGLTQRGLNNLLKHKKYPTTLIKRTIDELIYLGIISAMESTPGTRGRPTVKYFLTADG